MVAQRVDAGANHRRPLTWCIGMTAPVLREGWGRFNSEYIKIFATMWTPRKPGSRTTIQKASPLGTVLEVKAAAN